MVRCGAYFHQIFTLKKSKNIHFFYTKIMINCSHVLARGSRSMIHCPLIIFIKGSIYNVFDTISPSIFLLIFTFIHEIVIIKATRLLGGFESMLPGNFLASKMTKIMINCSNLPVRWV